MVQDLGRKLKMARIQAGYTQKQVADKLGFESDSTISAYEKSGSNPNAERLMKLAALYNVSADYLLGLDRRTEIRIDRPLSDKQKTLLQELTKEFIVHEEDSDIVD